MKKQHPPLTQDQIDLMISMRERNKSYEDIAEALGDGRNPKTIHWHCLKHGAEPKNPKFKRKPQPVKTVSFRRGNHVMRRFTPEDDKKLLELEAQRPALKMTEIAALMGRRSNSVKGRLYTLARHQQREEAS